jgi:hypothetical protein
MSLGPVDFLPITRRGPSFIRMEVASLVGSIPYGIAYSTIVERRGTAIDVTTNSTDGTVFKINQSGWYFLRATISNNSTQAYGWVKNSPISPSIFNATYDNNPNRLVVVIPTSGTVVPATDTVWLEAGDFVRVLVDAGTLDSAAGRGEAYIAYLGIG